MIRDVAVAMARAESLPQVPRHPVLVLSESSDSGPIIVDGHNDRRGVAPCVLTS